LEHAEQHMTISLGPLLAQEQIITF